MDAQRNGSDRSKSKSIFPKGGSDYFNPQELDVHLSEVARYAGGSRYRIDSEMESLARSMFNQARSLCRPVLGYVKHKIIAVVQGKGILIEDKVLIPCLPDILNEVEFIVSVVCTIGPNLEKDVHALNTNGMRLEALFLDASGVALLEAAAQKIMSKSTNWHAKTICFQDVAGSRDVKRFPWKPKKFSLISSMHLPSALSCCKAE